MHWFCAQLPKPISDRDFVWREFSTKLDDTTHVILAQSVEHPDCPAGRGLLAYVRAAIHASGYHIKATGDDKCFVSYLVQADPQGWLPTMVTNLVAADQASNVKRIREHFAARRKK